METSYLKTLELDKIIARAAEGCVCKEAREMLLATQPQCDPDEVRYALEQTDAINTLLIKNGSPRFGGVEGVSALAARAVKGGVLSMGELLMVAGALRNFQNLTNWYGSSEHDMLPTDDLFYALSPEPGLEQQISSAILAPDAMADTASRTLNDLRKKIRATENSIRDRLESMVRNMDTSKYLQESVVSMRNGRYVVPVKSEYRGEVSGIIHDVSSTGATVFVEPQAVVEANARILQYRAQEAQEIERILVAFTAQVATIEPQFQYSYQAMLDIDVLLAKARLALELKAFKPAVRTDNSFSLIRARHPLIDPQKCVPVDIALGKEYDSLIITGPNTGGKTVTLKTIGLLAAMTQCGLHIPCADGSTMPVFHEIMADIGDEQSIEQSLSTFSAHMTNTVRMLKECDDRSLLLFDELGAGTDPAEGAALAIAIIEHARKCGALIAATTHYTELKVYATTQPGVMNASCEFDVDSLRPTYHLLIGIPGKSNAFAISERLGLPQEIIDDARSRVSTESASMEATIEKLEQVRQLMERDRAEAARQLREAEENRRKSERLKAELSVRLEKADEKARRDAERIIGDARRTADEVMRELDELRKMEKTDADHHRANDARAALRRKLNVAEDAAAAAAHPQPREKKVSARPVRVGDTVQLRKMGDIKATVTAISADRTLTLRAGIMNVTAKEQDVYLLENEKPEAQKFAAAHAASLRNVAAESEIDLRGMDTMEAVAATERFLDNAVMAKLEKVTIIHGKGTGALRAAVQQSLRKNKAVKSYRLGRYGEGESGVTVVELK